MKQPILLIVPIYTHFTWNIEFHLGLDIVYILQTTKYFTLLEQKNKSGLEGLHTFGSLVPFKSKSGLYYGHYSSFKEYGRIALIFFLSTVTV